MTHPQQISAFVLEIGSVVDRFRMEFDLPVASVIGCLEMVKMDIFNEEMNDSNEN